MFKRQIRQLFVPNTSKLASCGAGKTTYAIDINGEIFPCHRFSGVYETSIGNVITKKEVEIKSEIYNNYKCNDCWNRNTCAKGCYYEMYQGEKSKSNAYYCIYAKKMTELAIELCMNMTEDQLMNIILSKGYSEENQM